MALQSPATIQPILGYEIRERLGAGGYGEVWKAIAPGAIEKAIKIVYGYHDDDRAARELKALNRIKEVRHPFLLSLDRIEVVDGQLVIVTELADMSLKDRFIECQRSGAAGISRHELLVYLCDAADALDYMSAQCSLQHLDVKPENLLLVGGRVKVADFGLVRDVHDAGASLMGGLTPVYAPPELFEGRPGLRSDQYSLAIVYHEMLTGLLPFSGSTAAELMAQHIRERPRLMSLPPSDRATIARALSKNPEDRFPCCRTMVDSLCAVAKSAASQPRAAAPVVSPGDARAQARVARGHTKAAVPIADAEQEHPVLVRSTSSTVDVVPVAVETVPDVTDLPSIELNEAEVELRPTLFLGIGGTAARILRRLRHRFSDRFGDSATLPAFQTLLLDTDIRTLLDAAQGDQWTTLTPAETVAMPLRRTQDYRTDPEKLLGWLSRRWLYNIPRSLQTEGRRPLGRVALVDHAERVFERVRVAIKASTCPQAVAASSAATGHRFTENNPRVFVIASISGGTGSGVVIDMAYAVRKILRELRLPDDGVCGILMHSTSREADARDLAIANAYACLKELHHCSHPSLAYPGAPECGIASFGESDRTFPNTYFVHLGDRLSETELDAATDDVAHYLYLDAATPTGTALEKCREPASGHGAQGSAGLQLRSFGLCRLGGYQNIVLPRLVDRLCRDLVRHWCDNGMLGDQQPGRATRDGDDVPLQTGDDAGRPPTDIDSLTTQHADQLGLELHQMLDQVTRVLEAHLGEDIDSFCRRHVQLLLAAASDRNTSAATLTGKAQRLAAVDASLGSVGVGPVPQTRPTRTDGPSLFDHLNRHATEQGQGVLEWILGLVDAPDRRLDAAARAADRLATRLRQIEAGANEMLGLVRQKIQQLTRTITEPATSRTTPRWVELRPRAKSDLEADPGRQIEAYCALKIQEHVAAGVLHVRRTIARDVAGAADTLTRLRRELTYLARQFDCTSENRLIVQAFPAAGRLHEGSGIGSKHCAPGTDSRTDPNALAGTTDDIAERAVDGLCSQWPQMVMQLEHELGREIEHGYGGLTSALTTGTDFRSKAATMLRAAARDVILKTFRAINVADVLFPDGAEQEEVERQLRVWLDAATPRLLCGGAKRLVLTLRKGTDARPFETVIERVADHMCSTVYGSDGDIVFCYEVEQVLPANVVACLTDNRADYAAIASRLHTRVDIAWTPLAQA